MARACAPRPLGRGAYRHPHEGAFGALIGGLVSCRHWLAARRWLFARLPFLALASDVRDVVYLNWLLPAERLRALVPAGLVLREHDGMAVLTVLTYRHGYFGPHALRGLRSALPSPLQSNWRVYLEDDAGHGMQAPVLFLENVMDRLPHVVGARLFSDALPSHLAARFDHSRAQAGYRTVIDPGAGSAPDLRGDVALLAEKALPQAWAGRFASWHDAVSQLALRECAVARYVDRDGLALAGITLPVDVETALPAALDPTSFHSDALADTVDGIEPFCFVVPRVPFQAVWERALRV